ncbi:5-formyltetrahydrofolate cyclo-ligase [Romeriopsis navalis]|uniref:5-formyltetrahydrofolate cyclo-ligase n=1 Tax=Romeriopsis navalis TaxID=2992132 RepID=UPI0021F86238|nr:5-formyltetrahydrofolate cyclo-ligase [Romeriopsis navalis]
MRRQWLAQRRALTVTDWQQRSAQICSQLRQFSGYAAAQTVLTYSSYRQEPDLHALLADSHKTWGFPRCVGRDLVWHRFDPVRHQLQPGAFGILEPDALMPQLVAAQVDLILVPCVGGDRQGWRLGYGGGFYDRLLLDPDWAKIPTIGITFDEMFVESLPVDPWDQPLQAFCTETAVYPRLAVS